MAIEFEIYGQREQAVSASTNLLHLIGICSRNQNRSLIQNADKYSVWWQWLIFAGWRSDCHSDIYIHDAVLGIELLRFDSLERQSSYKINYKVMKKLMLITWNSRNTENITKYIYLNSENGRKK